MSFGPFEKEASMNLAKHQGGSMQLTSRIARSLGSIFPSIISYWPGRGSLTCTFRRLLAHPSTHTSRGCRRTSVSLCSYSNRITTARYTHFVQREDVPLCVSQLTRSPHTGKLGKSSYGDRSIRQAIYNWLLQPTLNDQTTPSLLQCRSWIVRWE